MRFASYTEHGMSGLAALIEGTWRGRTQDDEAYPGSLLELIQGGEGAFKRAISTMSDAPELRLEEAALLPLISNPEKIICVGLNYVDHSAESGFEQPGYPAIFGRYNSSLIAHGDDIIRPTLSSQLDFEGELVAVIGKTARNVAENEALDYICGYSIFNDGSVRDYQFKAPQWTPGKNFDGTGAFGPIFVSADELPPGCEGLQLLTRLNGHVVQQASVSDLVFPVARLVAILSEFMTLSPGDVIVTGTPSGVGLARKPPLWMKPGDCVEVEIEQIGILRNGVRDQEDSAVAKVA